MLRQRKCLISLQAVLMIGVSGLIFPPLIQAEMRGMGHGMMGMQNDSDQSDKAKVNPERAKALLGYIHEQNLQCIQCHSVSGSGMAPSFASISAGYAHKKDAREILGRNIAHGIRNMPGGLATEAQSAQLAKMILMLDE